MIWLLLTAIFLVLIFGLVVFIGPPYVPTLRRQVDAALDILDLKEGQTLLELGSGDGRVMLAAAKRGLKVVGIEINPLLVAISWLITFRYRKQVRIVWGRTGAHHGRVLMRFFTFMLPKYMARLDKRMEQWRPERVLLASFAFSIPGKEPIETRNGIYLYEYK